MTSDVVVPGEDHRDEIVELMRVAYVAGSVPERAAWLLWRTCGASPRASGSSRPPVRLTFDSRDLRAEGDRVRGRVGTDLETNSIGPVRHGRTVVVTDETLFAVTGSAVVLETETVLSI